MNRSAYPLPPIFLILFSLACATGPADPAPPGEKCDSIGDISLNRENVPSRFRDLVTLAARWGTGTPEERDEMERMISIAEIDLLHEALHDRRFAIREWLRTAGRAGRGSAEACAFARMLKLYEDLLDMRLRRTLR